MPQRRQPGDKPAGIRYGYGEESDADRLRRPAW